MYGAPFFFLLFFPDFSSIVFLTRRCNARRLVDRAPRCPQLLPGGIRFLCVLHAGTWTTRLLVIPRLRSRHQSAEDFLRGTARSRAALCKQVRRGSLGQRRHSLSSQDSSPSETLDLVRSRTHF